MEHSTNSTLSTAAWFHNAGVLFDLFYTPLLCLFGAMGNGLSVWVFCMSPTHRNLSSSFYLSALAISDTGFLINLLAVWLTNVGFDVLSSRLTCPTIYYLGQVTSFLSVWLTVAFTVERFFAVCYPLTRPTVCTVARAKKVIFGLAIVAALAFSYMWIIATVVRFPIYTPLEPTKITATTATPSFNAFGNLRDENGNEIYNSQLINSTFHLNSEINCTTENCLKYPIVLDDRNEKHGDAGKIQGTGNYADSGILNENFENVTTATSYKSLCYVLEEYHHISRIANYADSVLTFIIPFFVITFLNLRIALCVWKLRDQRDHIMAPPRMNNSFSLNQRSSSKSLKDQLLNQSISSRRGSKSKYLFRNGFSVKYQEGNANTNSCSDSNLTEENENGGNGNPFVKINVELGKEKHAGCENTHLSPNRASFKIQQRSGGCNSSPSSSHTAAEVRVTKTLLLVSTVFLVLNLPSHATRATIFFKSLWGSKEGLEELHAVESWSNILFNTNFSVNFLLYCVSGRNFRKSLKNIFFGRGGDNSMSRRATSVRSAKSVRKSNRMTLNNTNVNTGNGNGHRRDTTSAKKSNDVEKESLFPASVTEIEMETTYA